MTFDEVLKIFRVFSDRTRLRIFLLLLDSELCVGELAALLQLEQSLISHQLKIMRQAGLVEARKSGRWNFYHLSAACQKQLGPLLREWLREELAVSSQKVKAVKDKQVCLTSRGKPRRLKSDFSLKRMAGSKGNKRKKR